MEVVISHSGRGWSILAAGRLRTSSFSIRSRPSPATAGPFIRTNLSRNANIATPARRAANWPKRWGTTPSLGWQ